MNEANVEMRSTLGDVRETSSSSQHGGEAQRTSSSNTVVNTLPKYNSSKYNEFLSVFLSKYCYPIVEFIWEPSVGAIFRSFQFPASPPIRTRQETTLRVANTLILERDFSDFHPPTPPPYIHAGASHRFHLPYIIQISISALFLQQ